MARRLWGRTRGITAIALMWLGFVLMYLGISTGSPPWNLAGLAVTGVAVIVVLLPQGR